jgi:hypothetical protein
VKLALRVAFITVSRRLQPHDYKGSLTSGLVLPEYPEQLPSRTRIAPLEPGTLVKP